MAVKANLQIARGRGKRGNFESRQRIVPGSCQKGGRGRSGNQIYGDCRVRKVVFFYCMVNTRYNLKGLCDKSVGCAESLTHLLLIFEADVDPGDSSFENDTRFGRE